MRHFSRLAAPHFFSENAARWNQQWIKLRSEKSGATFQWYRHKKQPINQKISPILSLQTIHHCSYCDAFPMGLADDTIDHFKPKGNPLFYHLAYDWKNLYYACADCQKAKREQFSDLLLSPDAPGFSFQSIFTYNFHSHEIEPNISASGEEQTRAEKTLEIFQLNHPSKVTQRRHSWDRWQNSPDNLRPLDDFAFRFIFE